MDPSAVSMKALERAVAVVNRIITNSTVNKAHNVDSTARGKGKWTKISAKARGQTHVMESRRVDKSLADYLALPVEEYSLLDPSWITREPNSNVFCLSAPVRGITGVELEPKVWVTVDIDAEKGTVTFHSDRACTGDASMDARLQLSFEGRLWRKPASKQAQPGRFTPWWKKPDNRSQKGVLGSQLPAAHQTSGNGSLARQASTAESEDTATDQPASTAVLQHSAHDSDVSLSSSLDTLSAGSAAANSLVIAEHEAEPSSSSSRAYSFTALASPEEDGDMAMTGSSTLQAHAKVSARVKLGPPLNVVPGFLISYTGGLIATAVLQALMPMVLELLGRDYETWAAGKGRKALR